MMGVFSTETFSAPSKPQTFGEGEPARTGSVLKNSPVETPMVFSAAAKSAEFSDRMRSHYRETRRVPVEIPCTVQVVLPDGTIFDQGEAMVRNVSPSGALITNFCLEGGNFPATIFKLRLVLNGDPYAGIGIEATPVRFAAGMHGIGVKFDEIFVAV